MKILVTGANGMLGSMVSEFLKENNSISAFGKEELDITQEDKVQEKLKNIEPDILINCAAYTAVDKAETDIETSNIINGYAPGILARHARNRGLQFIHISTDYVFGDNSQDGHTEEEIPGEDQLNQYSRSKRLGEIEVLKNNPDSYILRTSWVFGKNGKNFVDTMRTLAQTKDELSIVSDEIGVPTYTKDIARQIKYIIEHPNLNPGFYHAVNSGTASRYDEAAKIFELIGKEIKLNKILLKDYPRAVKIPNYSILINTKLPPLQSWEDAIKEYLFENNP